MVHLFLIKYITLLLPVFGFIALVFLAKQGKSKLIQLIVLLFVLLTSWTRLIEPNWIITQEHQVSNLYDKKIVLIADPHLGIYKNENFLQRVVNKINQIPDIDAVLIAGDLTFEPTFYQNLNDLLQPLSDIEVPVIAVLGNHDVEQPGPNIRNELVTALLAHNVIFLNNQTTQIDDLTIFGLGDKWGNEDDVSLIQEIQDESKTIIITHNPDTVYDYPVSTNSLTVAGHTHAGQIRIPYLYKKVIPTENPFDKGIHSTPKGPVFVTSGLGEVDLPMRFLNPPVIDILNL